MSETTKTIEIRIDSSNVCNRFRSDFEEHEDYYFDYSAMSENESLEKALIATDHLYNLFYKNKFDEAFAFAEHHIEDSLYHCHDKGFLSCVYALLTLEKAEMDKAKAAIEKTLQFCERKRRPNSLLENLSNLIWQTDFDKYTDYEIHAELIYAESQAMMALLTFFGDQSFISLIKGAFRVRASNQALKFCYEALKNKSNWDSDENRLQFESGVCNGVGLFNLYLSIVPDRILRLLQMAGFSGDYKHAIALLKRSTELKSGARFRVTALCVKAFQLYVTQIGGFCDYDIKWTQELIDELQSKFPNAIFVLFFSAKFNLMKGNLEKAIEEFLECMSLQESWKQIHNICRWDLVWAYAIKQDWKNAAEIAKRLRFDCSYSPASNLYEYAVFKMMEMEDERKTELKDEIDRAMRMVPQLKIRYAGKTIPQEKFFCTRAIHYIEEGREPIIALLETFYIWNVFSMINNEKTIQSFLQRANEKLEELQRKKNSENVFDQISCLLLVKGVLLRNLREYENSIKCLQTIIQCENLISRDTYLVPHAELELGITFFKCCNYQESLKWIRAAKSNEKKFLNEAVLLIRAHQFIKKIKEIESCDETDTHL
ncbi:tetratricopeptide repeat protein 39B-like protein [Dinothrombium tinctorium]|uniref:Tetratricopeptide repeat protein 39B-like protein n=1 Tax=Dinothrombium tinctorium TaxID=1965070 RepID=A0A443QM58_9ACAR|nr:tetratricopeptide repeat protein 39B-like protein [Dinothrombium tinctorium]